MIKVLPTNERKNSSCTEVVMVHQNVLWNDKPIYVITCYNYYISIMIYHISTFLERLKHYYL